jgi:hypothetical protein
MPHGRSGAMNLPGHSAEAILRLGETKSTSGSNHFAAKELAVTCGVTC